MTKKVFALILLLGFISCDSKYDKFSEIDGLIQLSYPISTDTLYSPVFSFIWSYNADKNQSEVDSFELYLNNSLIAANIENNQDEIEVQIPSGIELIEGRNTWYVIAKNAFMLLKSNEESFNYISTGSISDFEFCIGDDQNISWEEGEGTYHLQISTTNEFATNLVDETGLSDNSYDISILTEGSYYWRIQYVMGTGSDAVTSEWTNPAKIIIHPLPTTNFNSAPPACGTTATIYFTSGSGSTVFNLAYNGDSSNITLSGDEAIYSGTLGVSDGLWTWTVTDENGCSADYQAVQTIGSGPADPFISAVDICEGDNLATITFSDGTIVENLQLGGNTATVVGDEGRYVPIGLTAGTIDWTYTTSDGACTGGPYTHSVNIDVSGISGSWPTVYTSVVDDEIHDIHGANFNNIWAVGSPAFTEGNIYKWNGSFWALHTNMTDVSAGRAVYGVYALDEDNVWITGNRRIYRYNSVTDNWDVVYDYPFSNTGHRLKRIWAADPNNVWAVGYYDNSDEYRPRGATNQGGSWDYLLFTSIWNVPSNHDEWVVSDITGTSANDVWVVTRDTDNTGGGVSHWDGSSWSEQELHLHRFYGVDAVASNNIWATASSGNIYHYDGSTWSVHTTLPDYSGITPYISGIWFASADNGYIVGSAGSNYLLYHWDGTNWSQVNTLDHKSYRVWGLNACDMWVVGGDSSSGPGNILINEDD